MSDKDLIAEARKCAPGDDATELAVIVHRLADALEAVTRVPVQGEPNEDRPFNAKGVIVAAINQVDAKHDLGSGDLASSEEYADAILAAIPRATVPDAATEAGRWYQLYEKGVEERVELRAECDAALAAIERVRAIHVRDTPSIGGDWCLDDHHKWPCPTIRALDGAPEPEEKP